jgi:glyoxylase-like metal-dependent hydrolase (beta-lactamase superfamily II)
MMRRLLLLFFLSLVSATALAAPFKVTQVNDRVYALVGELGQRSPTNLGHNMTSGFVIADDGVVVVDTGGSERDAEAIHAAIRQVTKKPILWAVNTGGQDHRWLGNEYFRRLGVPIIASKAAVRDMQDRGAEQVSRAQSLLGKAFAGTRPAYPNHSFTKRYTVPVRGVDIRLIYTGGGHTPGDIFVWLPEKRIVFTGDMVFVQRLLGILPGMGFRWIKSLEYLRDTLHPLVVVPGHGHVTDLQEAMHDSYDYLLFLRESAQQALANGAFDPVEASQGLDQSRFSYLANYDDIPFRSRSALRMAEEVFAASGNSDK